jgi:hypothetical protein
MRAPECNREMEVMETISSGRHDASLDQHIQSCALCQDVVTVVRALHEERTEALAEVRVPPAGLVWWKAELRARQDAMRIAQRPLTVTHAFAGACAIGVGIGLLSQMLPWIQKWMSSMGDLPTLNFFLGAVIALAVATPLALYFVFSDK